MPQAAEGEEIMFDYAATGLSLRRHPLALLRPRLARHGLKTAAELRQMLLGQKVRACGIVTVRQRPPTANGTLFITLEDETGVINLVVWSQTFARWLCIAGLASAGRGGRLATQHGPATGCVGISRGYPCGPERG